MRGEHMYFAGIDIGGTAVKLCVMDQNGDILREGSVKTIRENPEGLADLIAQALEGFELPLTAAGVSCAGRVNTQTGLIIASNLKWMRVPFRTILEERLGCPVSIDNDVAGALYGEWTKGACVNERNVLYLTLGTGVGGAFLLDGKPYRGHDNTGGEVGHMITHADGLPCACGGRGCMEQYTSMTALSRMAGGITTYEVFRRAAEGDEKMNRVLDEYAHELVIGLANLTGMLRFELVVLGGGGANAGEPLLRRVREQLYEHCPSMPTQEKPRITLATLGNKAGMIGGGMLAIRRWQEAHTQQGG